MKVKIINYETKVITLENSDENFAIATALQDGVNKKLELLSFNIRRKNKERIEELISEIKTVIKLIRNLGYDTAANDMNKELEKFFKNEKEPYEKVQ